MGIALAAISLLIGCEGGADKGSATPEAALQFAELQLEVESLIRSDWMAESSPEELLQVVQKFMETADPSYCTPTSKYNILHLACMLKKPELARCLLLDGAQANAATINGDGMAELPLHFALATDYTPEATAERINQLIDVLVAAGASLEPPGSDETSLTYIACLTCAYEEVYAHLLDIGVPRTGNELAETAYRGWAGTLDRLLQEKGGISPEDFHLLTLVARMSGGYYDGEHLKCVRYLLERGVPVDARDEAGRTALFCVAAGMSTMQECGRGDAALELATYLLQQGANPYERADNDPDYPGFSPYDLLSANPSALNYLREKGFTLNAPAIEIRSDEHLSADVCRAAMLQASGNSLAPFFDTIATLLTPSEELRHHELYPDALRNAIILMAKVDPARTSAIIATIPLWNDSQIFNSHDHIASALIFALQDTPSIVLPEQLLLHTAERMQEAQAHELAAILTEMIGRCPDSDHTIARLKNDPRLPIQAGAWGASLYKEGLPSACNGAVAAWLADRKRRADTPILQKALLLTSIEEMWYGNMDEAQINNFIAAMEEIGATNAAAIYRAIADNLSNPEVLDELMTSQDVWAYELEIATARYLLEHKTEILDATSDSVSQPQNN